MTINTVLVGCALVITWTQSVCSFDVIGPLDADVLLGEDAILDCIITYFDGSSGKWSKVNGANDIFGLYYSAFQGTGYVSAKHSDWSVDTTRTNHYDLKIPNVDINDEGCYFCGIGTADSNSMSNTCGNLRVIGNSFDVVGPLDVDILLEENATLNCVITDFAGSVGKWSKVDEADEIFTLLSFSGFIGPGHDSTKHSNWSVDTTGTNHYDLKIPNVDINDEGCYFCGIGDADSNSMSNTCGNLRVIVPLSRPPVLTNYNHGDTAVVTRNVMTTFICTTLGTKPSATIEWYIGSTQITNDITTSDTQSNGLYDTTSTLQYIPVWNSDQDKDIKCEAYVFTTHTHYSTYVTLDVLVPPSLPVINGYNNNDDFTVNAGMSSTLTCIATAKPAPTIEWYIDNTLQSTTMTSPTPNSEDSGLFDVSSTFTFTPQWSNHLQYVKCKADNDAIGNAVVTRVKLDVNVAVSTIIISDDANTGGYISGDDVIVTDGISHILTCETIGSKPAAAHINWNTQNIPVVQSSDSDSPNSGDNRLFDTTSTIEFTPLWSYHSKTITCEGSNSANIQPVITNIKLDVQVPPGSVEIPGSSPARIVIVIAYQTTIMTCVAMGARPSAEIDWTTDSTSLSDNEIISDNADNSYLKDTTSTMIFTPNYLDHQNTTLTCEAINSATVAKRQTIIEDITLDVWEPPDSLYFENYLDNSDVTIVAGVPFLLTCTTTNAHPAANLYWYKDDDVITNDVISRVLWDIDGRQDTISQLSLTAKRKDFGKKIKCKTDHGALSTPWSIAIHMVVKYLPVVIGGSRHFGEVGSSVSMVLFVDAYPLPVTFGNWTNEHLHLDNKNDTLSTSTVTIDTVTEKHFGIYNITAFNDVGLVILQVELIPSVRVASCSCSVGIIIAVFVSILGCGVPAIVVIVTLYRRIKKQQSTLNAKQDEDYTTLSHVTKERQHTYEQPLPMTSKTVEDDGHYTSLSPATREKEPTYETPTSKTTKNI